MSIKKFVDLLSLYLNLSGCKILFPYLLAAPRNYCRSVNIHSLDNSSHHKFCGKLNETRLGLVETKFMEGAFYQ